MYMMELINIHGYDDNVLYVIIPATSVVSIATAVKVYDVFYRFCESKVHSYITWSE